MYPLVHSEAYGPDEDLGVHARRDEPRMFGRQPWSKRLDSHRVLGIRRVEESDEDVSVEDYRSHSSRSSSR